MKNIPDTPFDTNFLTTLKLLPNLYLKYYYMTDAMLQHELEECNSQGTRGTVATLDRCQCDRSLLILSGRSAGDATKQTWKSMIFDV